MDKQMIEQIIEYVKQHREEIFSRDPEKVADDIMDVVKQYGIIGKLFIKYNWNRVKHYIANPVNALNEVKQRDPELYNYMMKHVKWLNKFFKSLYVKLKMYADM